MTTPSNVTLTRLRRKLKSAGITHEQWAAEGDVGRTMITNLLAGRTQSLRLITIGFRMIEDATGTGRRGRRRRRPTP